MRMIVFAAEDKAKQDTENVGRQTVGSKISSIQVTTLLLLHKISKIYTNCIRFEVCTAVSMKNDVFWNIKTQFVSHRRHITSPLQGLVS
jgi:hypothetical protein